MQQIFMVCNREIHTGLTRETYVLAGMSKFAKLARSVTRNKSVILQQQAIDGKSEKPSQLTAVSK